MLTPLLSLVVKEFRQTFRDPRMLGLLVVAPLIQLLVLGYAVNLQVEQVPTLLADEDRTPQSRALLQGLTAGDTFVPAGWPDSAAAAAAAVSRGEAPLAVVVPRGHAADLLRGRTAQVQVLVDGGDSNRAIVATNALSAFLQQRALRLAEDRIRQEALARGMLLQPSRVRVEPRILYNPTLQSRIYFVPGVGASLLLVVTMIVTAMGMARERESGTLEGILVTPLTPTTLLLGKTLPYAAIGLVDLGLVVAGGAWVFDVPLRGSLLFLFAAGLLYILTLLGLGLLVGSAARTQQQAFFGAFLFVMPALLLSGFVTPVENMPAWLQPLTLLDPVRHFVEVMRGVLLEGASPAELSDRVLALAALSVTVYGSAILILRRRLG